MVFYRKYRPQVIDDLDNKTVRETLLAVLKNSETHAFLFTGPKGLGKTSTARIIAKVVNCKNKKKDSLEPCNTCEQCVSITQGNNLDVLEIDAASNRGIDEIRDLKEKIRLVPVAASKKVYIIDEVHMLTTEAFNALLKTLEEPPSHAMFILCTTEPHKIPATILSRCFHINFSLATDAEIVRSLKRVALGENLKIDEAALLAIAKMAEGGFRDGTKMLEEIAALADGKKVTTEFIEEKYKTVSVGNHITDLLKNLKDKNTNASLAIIQKTVEQGVDMKYFLQQLIEKLHEELLGTIANQPSVTSLTLEEIKVLVMLFSSAYQDMKFAVLPQLPLELVVIDYCQTEGVVEQIIQEEEIFVEKIQSGVTVSSLRKKVGTIKKVQALYGDQKQDVKPIEPAIKTTTIDLMHASPNGDVTPQWLESFWQNIISEMKNYNHTIAGVLRGCSIKSYDKKTLVIQTIYKFHKERLDEVKTQEALVKVCKLLTGKMIEVKVELSRG